MGARGPKPTPTETLKARGSWRAKERGDYAAPLFPVEKPSCPDWLPTEGKAEWRRVVGKLLKAGVLAKVNRSTLSAYCECWARYVQAVKEIEKGGAVLISPKGFSYQSPWVIIANTARAEVSRLAQCFGMTPSSAGKVAAAPEVEVVEDETQGKGRFFKTVG